MMASILNFSADNRLPWLNVRGVLQVRDTAASADNCAGG